MLPGRTVAGSRFGHPTDLEPRPHVRHVHGSDCEAFPERSRFQFDASFIRQRDRDGLLQRLVSDDDGVLLVRLFVAVGDVVVCRGRIFRVVVFARFVLVDLVHKLKVG